MDDSIKIERLGPLFLQGAELIQPFVCPLMLLPSREAGPEDMVNCGSAGLIDTGTKKLLVTCNHVWSALASHLRGHPEAVAALGRGNGQPGLVINDFPLIDSSADLDLAILLFSEPDALDHTSKRFWTASEWPPRRAQAGDRIIALGWPKKNRTTTPNERDTQLYGIAINDVVASVSDRHLVLADSPDRTVFEHVPDLIVEGSHGGMSGCPAFVVRDNEKQFIGIVYESSDGAKANFFISHACYITATGHIDRLLAPPSFK